VLNGVEPPGPADGEDGDFWIDTDTNIIYGPKVGVTWGVGTSLVGPPGSGGGDGYDYGVLGPHGIGPALTYTGEQLTRVDYDGGDYKLLIYTGDQLTRVDWVIPSIPQTIRKDLVYSGDQLTAVNQTTL
jgi:hypothetical protein